MEEIQIQNLRPIELYTVTIVNRFIDLDLPFDSRDETRRNGCCRSSVVDTRALGANGAK